VVKQEATSYEQRIFLPRAIGQAYKCLSAIFSQADLQSYQRALFHFPMMQRHRLQTNLLSFQRNGIASAISHLKAEE
jgi:hypothetical protein